MVTRRQLLVGGLAVGIASVTGCSSPPRSAGNGRPLREFGIATDPWKATDWARAVGAKPTMVMEFESWDRNRGLDTHFRAARDQGMKSMTLTWEPWATVDAGLGQAAAFAGQPRYSNQAIVSGQLDSYIRMFAESVKQSELTVYLRYAHEMNGTWYPWSHEPDRYVLAWKHIVEVFRSVGAKNAKFVFAPAANLLQGSDDAWLAQVQQYWPGPDHVDYVGTTMVNLGRKKSYTVQQFVPRLKLMHTTHGKDVILAEVNSAADGRVKFFTDLRTWLGTPDADWVHAMILSQLPSRGQASMGNTVGNLDWQVTNDAEVKPVGVHLLLSSQRLEEGKLRGLDTYLSYRIGLRTFSAVESRIVLGVPDAYELPQAPGHGYLKVDTQTMLRFRAAYVSGPYRAAGSAPRSQAAVQRRVVKYGLGHVAVPELPAEPVADQPAEPGKQVSMLDVIAGRLEGQGQPAHQVWLPPLGDPPSLDELLPPLAVDERLGLCPPQWTERGGLVAPVGVVDRPFEQRRDPMVVDLGGAGGNVVILGGPQSGKSTLLRSLLSSLALTHTPWEVQFFCLDFGGGGLRALDGLPHLSGVAGRRDAEAVRRSVAEVNALIDEREARFTALGIDSIASYRRRRATGEVTDDPFGDVFLVVDGWGTLRQEFEELEQAVTNIASRGLGFGVHVVITAARWAELRSNLRDFLGTRLELRLGEPTESEIDRRAAANVPANNPGRGLTRDKLHFLAAVSRIDGRHTVDDTAEGTAHLVAAVRAAWPFRAAPRVRLLPRTLPLAQLAQVADRTRPGIAVGLNETRLAPVYLDFATEPHLMVLGDAESGKTNLLRLVARSIVDRYTPAEARLVIADYRRGLLGAVTGEHVLGYAPGGPAFAEMVASTRSAMLNRLPGPDVTTQQLRDRSWWRGPEVYVLVDDYDLVATAGNNPLSSLLELLPQARDIGLHLILTRRTGGAARALYEPVLQRLRELDAPGLLLSGNREEGPLFGNLRPSPQPAGRGHLVRRQDPVQLIQTAWCEP